MSLKTMLREKVALVFKKREDVVLCKELEEAPGPHKSSGRLQAIPIRPEHKNHLEQFIRAHHADVARSLRMLDNCFRHGYEGRLALLDGEIIGYRWWVTHAMKHSQLTLYQLSLRPDEVFAFGLYIGRAFRAQGYAGEFLAITQKQLRDLGYKRLCNAVGASNVPARRLYENFGSKALRFCTARIFFSAVVLSGGRVLRYDSVWM